MEPGNTLAGRALGYDINPGGTQLFAVQITFLGLAWISILFRGYVRIVMIKHVSTDDYLMFAAVIIYTAYSIIAVWGIFGGTGEHTGQLTAPQAAQALEAWFLCEVIYAPLSALVRTSIGVFLLRIATQKVHRAIIYATLAVIWLLSIIYFFLMMFQCSPPSHFWEQVYRKPGSCMDPNVVPAATIAHSVISAVCDFILALLPIAMMWSVQLNKRTKLTIAALLSMGLIAGVALVVRIPYIKFLAISSDFLFETIDVAIWSVMEPSLGIIAGCVATLRPLFKAWGIGPSSSAKRYAYYPSKPRSNGVVGGSSAVWRQSRGMHKLEDELTTKDSKDKPGKASDASSSDIELVRPANINTKPSSSSPENSQASWDLDIEQGGRGRADWQMPPTAVFVQTSINITSDSVPGSPAESASTATSFPLQGARTVSVKGPEKRGSLKVHTHPTNPDIVFALSVFAGVGCFRGLSLSWRESLYRSKFAIQFLLIASELSFEQALVALGGGFSEVLSCQSPGKPGHLAARNSEPCAAEGRQPFYRPYCLRLLGGHLVLDTLIPMGVFPQLERGADST